MDEYISKRLAIEELENLRQQYEMHDDCDELVAKKCKAAVAALAVADVAPVVHARWEDNEKGYGEPRCSNCKNDALWDDYNGCAFETDYCPHCGAKMDLSERTKTCSTCGAYDPDLGICDHDKSPVMQIGPDNTCPLLWSAG